MNSLRLFFGPVLVKSSASRNFGLLYRAASSSNSHVHQQSASPSPLLTFKSFDQKLADQKFYGDLIYNLPTVNAQSLKMIKYFSLFSSFTGLVGTPLMLYKTAAAAAGAYYLMVGASCFIIPFCLGTPYLLNFLTKRSPLQIFYDESSNIYTAVLYNVLCRKKSFSFKPTDIFPPGKKAMFASVVVGRKFTPLLVDSKNFTDMDHCGTFFRMENYGLDKIDDVEDDDDDRAQDEYAYRKKQSLKN